MIADDIRIQQQFDPTGENGGYKCEVIANESEGFDLSDSDWIGEIISSEELMKLSSVTVKKTKEHYRYMYGRDFGIEASKAEYLASPFEGRPQVKPAALDWPRIFITKEDLEKNPVGVRVHDEIQCFVDIETRSPSGSAMIGIQTGTERYVKN